MINEQLYRIAYRLFSENGAAVFIVSKRRRFASFWHVRFLPWGTQTSYAVCAGEPSDASQAKKALRMQRAHEYVVNSRITRVARHVASITSTAEPHLNVL
jgi:hypothetical protein